MSLTHQHERTRWRKLLHASAEAGKGQIPPGLAPWFFAYRGLIPTPTTPPKAPDDRLWSCLISAAPAPPFVAMRLTRPIAQSLFPHTDNDAIEIWTEQELAGMHALSHLQKRDMSLDQRARLDAAAEWHLEHTQPDNATGRPWAIHVFVRRWLERGEAESRLYAETLLHNCRILAGKPDPVSAEILLDAAEFLDG